MSMLPQQGVEIREETARVARAAFRRGSAAMSARDELGEVFTDDHAVNMACIDRVVNKVNTRPAPDRR
jgi:hypothetical protein